MICICAVCPVCSEGVWSALYSQNFYTEQVYVFPLGKQNKHRVILLILDVFVEEGAASVWQVRKLRHILCVWGSDSSIPCCSFYSSHLYRAGVGGPVI